MMVFFTRRYIMLNSETVADAEFRKEVDFLIGRFVGASAARHHRFMWFEIILSRLESLVIFNLLLMPYERAAQYSGDQMGLHFIDGDLKTAMSAMVKLMVGREVADQVNITAVLNQERDARGSFFVWFARALSRFPHTTSRMVNLLRYGQEAYPQQTSSFLSDRPRTRKVIDSFQKNPAIATLRLVPPDHTMPTILANRDIWVGRDLNADLNIDRLSVSRNHAQLYLREDGALDVRDNGSSNGTFINGHQIDTGTVTSGDVLSFGDVNYRVE